MTYEPLVSIVIPVYNGANYLTEAIEAALAQTYKKIEIIVVNDGSTDDGESAKIALSYGDKIRYFEKPNGGVSTALNLAIANMKGEWFSWLSHDDLYLPGKIDQQIQFINRLMIKYPEFDKDRSVIYCKNFTVNSEGKVIKKKIFALPEYMNRKKMILKHIKNFRIGGCAVLIPRNAFNDVGLFAEDIRTASDKEYWFRLINYDYSYYFLNKRLVKNRVHKKQVGKVYSDRLRDEVDLLDCSIMEDVWNRRTDETWSYFFKLACYLTKREHNKAAEKTLGYAEILSKNSRKFRVAKRLWLPIYRVKGKMFYCARAIFRRLTVR